jgi:hypothetical protein
MNGAKNQERHGKRREQGERMDRSLFPPFAVPAVNSSRRSLLAPFTLSAVHS